MINVRIKKTILATESGTLLAELDSAANPCVDCAGEYLASGILAALSLSDPCPLERPIKLLTITLGKQQVRFGGIHSSSMWS